MGRGRQPITLFPNRNINKWVLLFYFMKRVIGYVVALAGLFVLVFGAGIMNIPAFAAWDASYLNILGIGMVIVGVYIVLVFSKKNDNRTNKGIKDMDLPVYAGDRVIAYRRS